ncbi:MAG: hypothetical protein NVS4B1_10070 [Ktedonobacteraceae bacterium]
MPEQQQQDSEQHTHGNFLIEKKPTPISNKDATKRHKVKRRRKRHNKYPSSHVIPDRSEAVVVDTETIVDTPLPTSIEGAIETHVEVAEMDVQTDPAVPAISAPIVAEPIIPTTPAIIEKANKAPVTGKAVSPLFSWRTVLTCALLVLLLTNIILLWQDLTATHLYVSTFDANNGSIRTQQDLGGYRDAIHLTAPLAANNDASATLLGVYTPDGGGTQQLLTLHGTPSTLSQQRAISLANGAITQAANGRLLVESANGLYVLTQDGQVTWYMQGQQPTRGVHHFQPASDTEGVYTIKDVIHAQIAAYALANGHMRWTHTLPDTLEYAPPFLLDGNTLYVASDHHVFALNTQTGSVLWEKPYASRTLLLENDGQHHFLIALSSQGIQALQSDTGEVAWSFRGDPAVSTLPTQFYQGILGRSNSSVNNNTVYTTGVVWHMPNVREDVWLYAIDATTGKMHWSRQIAAGGIGVDAGRVLQPLLDTEHSMIIVQHAIRKNENAVTAYDTSTGAQRWNTSVMDMNTASPIVFQLSKHTFAVFTTTTHSKLIFWTPSFYRTCILLLLLVSSVGILLLLFLPREKGKLRIRSVTHSIKGLRSLMGQGDRYLPHSPHAARALPYVFVVALLCVCIGISIFAYIRSSVPEYQQLATDAQGSIVTTNTGDTMHQLEARNPNGTSRWTLFNSEGIFSVPKEAQTQAGTLLVALHGNTTYAYVIARDDPAYPRPLDAMLALYLLDRTTGHILWQQVVSYPDEQQNTEVKGADATYIYIVGEHALAPSTQSDAKSVIVPQLFAVNKLTGAVDWRIFGPSQLDNKQQVSSTLSVKNGLLLWQVADTVFTIDVPVGQIIARKTA